MGIGDEIMAAGQAERLARERGAPVCILGQFGDIRWSPMWQNNPHISREMVPLRVVNGPGARPYIRYPFTAQHGQRFTDWRARDYRATLYLSAAEIAAADLALRAVGVIDGDFFVIEPDLKPTANQNKRLPALLWQKFARFASGCGIELVQVGPERKIVLDGVRHIPTPSMRDACAVLARSSGYIGHEGALHHAAAALKVGAVVVFGGATSAQATGYPEHHNIGGEDACGSWEPCAHCAAFMQTITVETLVEALQCL